MATGFPSVSELIRCTQRKLQASFEAIAQAVSVTEPTVWRWAHGEIRPTAQNLTKLVALHNVDFCEHTVFEYICDHPDLEAPLLTYKPTNVTDLIALDDLRTLAHAHSVRHGERAIRIIPVENLLTQSRSYRTAQLGPPVFLVFVRSEVDEATRDSDARREINDHILNSGRRQATLSVFESTKTVLAPHRVQRTSSGADRARFALRRLGGESAADLAHEAGVTPAKIEAWRRRFVNAGRKELK